MPGALSLPHVPRSLITRTRTGLMGVSLIGVRLVLSWGCQLLHPQAKYTSQWLSVSATCPNPDGVDYQDALVPGFDRAVDAGQMSRTRGAPRSSVAVSSRR